SAQQMVITGGDLKDRGIRVPLLVGGAALSEKFTQTKIGPTYAAPTFYAKDAMTGLRLLNEIMDPALREQVLTSHIFAESGEQPAVAPQAAVPLTQARSSKVRSDIPIPAAPYLDRRVRDVPNLAEL